MDYAALKSIHMLCALISFSGFFLRGVWMLMESPLLNHRLTRIAPHVIDTVLLATAIAMLFQLSIPLASSSWLIAKILALLIYIGLGMIALRRGRTLAIRFSTWLLGLATFAYIVIVALTKSPLGPLALI